MMKIAIRNWLKIHTFGAMYIIHYLLKYAIEFLSVSRKFMIDVFCKFTPRVTRINVTGNIDLKFDTSSDDSLIKTMLNPDKKFETEELKLFSVLAEKSEVIFDIGANIGVYSLLASKINPGTKIFAFEPNPVNFGKLKNNVDLNRSGNIFPQNYAVGDNDNSISFSVPVGNKSTSVSAVNPEFTKGWHKDVTEITVKQVTLDDFVSRGNIVKTPLIKMDVEYYEMNVLMGAKDLIKKFKPTILCEINIYEILVYHFQNMKGKLDERYSYQVEDFFISNGYSIYTLGEYGIMKVSSIHNHPDMRNFLFSVNNTANLFTPYTDKSELQKLINSF